MSVINVDPCVDWLTEDEG